MPRDLHRITPFLLPGLAALLATGVAAVSASAEDAGVHAFLQSEARARAPAVNPVRLAPATAPAPWMAMPRRVEHRRAPPQTNFARLPVPEKAEPAPPPMPTKAKEEIENPLPLLLRDETLRAGDIVVFPDGPRIFEGEPGSHHVVTDFVKPSRARLASATRKTLASITVGRNDAWRAGPDTQLAKRDVESTGSTHSAKHRRR